MAVSRSVTICNQRGLHARASALFVRMAETYIADVTVSCDNASVGGTSIMGLMMLAAGPGVCITIAADGPDEDEALASLVSLVEAKFHEE